ncbi:hypothetical protein [Dethiothermospora halolimnae]|uniref:hypothetical protein n=1 Tax=Dethiothermospora halolimnae TaxID=3114390 RepID=UPI003CCBCC28
MIGNKYLRALFEYPDEDTSLNQLLELLKTQDKEFIDSLYEPIDIEMCNKEELEYLIKISALIDYKLQMYGMKVPDWIRNGKLRFEKPYYHSKRLSDFDKFKLLYTSPAPFSRRNVYFHLQGIKRI